MIAKYYLTRQQILARASLLPKSVTLMFHSNNLLFLLHHHEYKRMVRSDCTVWRLKQFLAYICLNTSLNNIITEHRNTMDLHSRCSPVNLREGTYVRGIRSKTIKKKKNDPKKIIVPKGSNVHMMMMMMMMYTFQQNLPTHKDTPKYVIYVRQRNILINVRKKHSPHKGQNFLQHPPPPRRHNSALAPEGDKPSTRVLVP